MMFIDPNATSIKFNQAKAIVLTPKQTLSIKTIFSNNVSAIVSQDVGPSILNMLDNEQCRYFHEINAIARPYNTRFEAIHSFISHNFKDSLIIKEMVNIAGLNQYYFTHLFKHISSKIFNKLSYQWSN